MLIPREIFKVHKIGDVESTSCRHSLNGIRLQRSSNMEPIAVATNGRILLAVGWKEDRDKMPEFPNMTYKPGKETDIGISDKTCREFFRADTKKNPNPWAKVKLTAKQERSYPQLNQIALDEQNANGQIHVAATNGEEIVQQQIDNPESCLLYTSPSPRDRTRSRMPSSA